MDSLEKNILEILDKGGVVSWVLIALSVLALALIIMKIFHFMVSRPNNNKEVKTALSHLANNQDDVALNNLKKSKSPTAKVMKKAIGMIKKNHKPDDIKEAVRQTGNMELSRLRSFIPWLDTIAVTAPLLGLLGTVIGMIKAFRQLESAGVQVDVTMLAGGIWEALLTTAIGLVVSIIALVAVNGFEGRIERARDSMEIAVSKLFQLAKV